MTDARPQVRYWVPEGCASEEGLRADARTFARRGFGAIELVSLNFFGTPVTDEQRWGMPGYYESVRTVLDEASKLGLAVDIANGPGWPISSPVIHDADDPATLYELTYGACEVAAGTPAPLTLPERHTVRDEGTPTLVAACAYRVVGEKLLDETSYVDLLPLIEGERIAWAPEGDGTWAVLAFWGQPSCHKVGGQFYVIDHLSREGAQASIDWWEQELLPALGDAAPYLRSFFCDSVEYQVNMEWTRDFLDVFEERCGYALAPYLPVVGEPGTYPKNEPAGYAFADAELTRTVRHDYLATISWMYEERHLRTLAEGAARLGKSVRYQVAYNKPFCEEDAAAAVQIPETESLGRPTLDNLRVMAGPAHLARKPYLSFEAAAEFGSGYGQTQEDLMWWLKRAAMAGCGAQVFHGSSYCGDGIEGVAWPGWEAWNRICSNNWNRTLSERSFAQMTAAITRMNALRRERALVDLAFWREAYLNDGHGADGAHYVHDDGLLCAHGYSYEFLSPKLLTHQNAFVRDGRLDPDGSAYKALVLAEVVGIPAAALRRVGELAAAGLPVYVLDPQELAPATHAELADRAAWEAARDALLAEENVFVVDDYPALLAALAEAGLSPDASYHAGSVVSAHTHGDEGDCYLLYNGNRTGADPTTGKIDTSTTMPAVLHTDAFVPVELELSLVGEGEPCLHDLASGQGYALEAKREGGRVTLDLSLEPDQLVAICLRKDTTGLPHRSFAGFEKRALVSQGEAAFELQPTDDLTDFLAGGFHKVSELPERSAGYQEYRFSAQLDAVPAEAYLRLPAYSDALELEVNGQALPVVAGLGRTVDAREALRTGDNKVVIRVYTNLSNRLDEHAGHRYGLFGEPLLLMK